jgi:hypothetical protein
MPIKHPPSQRRFRCRASSKGRLTTAWFFVNICVALSPAVASSHSELLTAPCDIRLVFGTDVRGMPSVAYKLGLQIRNRAARHIAGVSLYWLDSGSAIIGNSSATCGAKIGGIGPSEAGQCETIVQQIGGSLLQKLGQTTWTEIINHELTNFNQVKQCAVVGFDYHDHQPKTY